MFASRQRDWMARWSCRTASAGSRRRCRPGPGTSTRTSCRATTAGRSSTRESGSECAGGVGGVARRRRGGPDLRHPLPPRSRRCRGRRRRADEGAGAPGRARLRPVRAGLGEPELARADRGLVPHPRRPGRDHRGADRLRRRLPALHPLPARSDPRRRRRPPRRLGARRRAGPRRRAALPAQGARARLGRPPARPDLADGRPLAGEPARPARRLPRVARAHDRARSGARAARSRRPDRRPGRPGARADRAPPRAARVRRGGARPTRRAAPTRSRSTSSAPTSSRRRAASRSPRRSRTSSGSCSRNVRNDAKTSESLPILRASLDEPSSTHAPESGA